MVSGNLYDNKEFVRSQAGSYPIQEPSILRQDAAVNDLRCAPAADQTGHLLHLLRNGGTPSAAKAPRAAILLIGTNDMGVPASHGAADPSDFAAGAVARCAAAHAHYVLSQRALERTCFSVRSSCSPTILFPIRLQSGSLTCIPIKSLLHIAGLGLLQRHQAWRSIASDPHATPCALL